MALLRRILVLECGCKQPCFCGEVRDNRHYCYKEHFDMKRVIGVKTMI